MSILNETQWELAIALDALDAEQLRSVVLKYKALGVRRDEALEVGMGLWVQDWSDPRYPVFADVLRSVSGFCSSSQWLFRDELSPS